VEVIVDMDQKHETDLDFHGRTALVTGAAHGIGRAICAELAARGASVHACDVLVEDMEDTRAACAARGGRCQAHALDVRDEAAVNALVRAIETHEPVDTLVNVAGGVLGQVGRPLETVSLDDWNAIVAVNLSGVFLLSRAVAPSMKERRFGRIVNISSGAGRSVSLTNIQAYTSAKAGQIGLTRQLAHELGPWNITVNNIAPGFILSNPSTLVQWESYGEEGQRRLVEGVALKRLGEPEDIAYAVLFFASNLARWCTGQVLSVDGGHSMF
jgi:3-oxoacyl-[acyl-carrier protein] reductase